MKINNKNQSLLLLGAIVLITVVIYAASLKGEFLSYDDTDNIAGNMLIRDLSPKALPAFFRSTNLYMYSPVTFISYAFDYKMHGLDPFYFRLTNLLIHLANILLVFFMAQGLFRRDGPSLVIVALFAFHPANVDSVAWISARSNLLATLFFLLTLICYQGFLRKNNYLFYCLSLVAFLLSLFSKSAGVMLPFTLLILDFLLKRKLNVQLVLEKIPFFVIAFLFGLIAIWFRTDTGATQTVITYSMFERFFMICYSILNYLVISLFPFHLSEIYGYPLKSEGTLPIIFYLAPIMITGLVILILRMKSIRREVMFGLVFFFLNIIVTQVVFLEDSYRANRYAYMPFLGLFYLLIVSGDEILIRKYSLKKYAPIPILIISLLFGVITYQRSLIYKNTLDLFNHAINQSPDAAFAYNSRGIAKYSQGDLEGALTDYDQAIVLNPKYSGAYYNRGIVYYNTGKYENAMDDYSKGISLNPNFANSFIARGIIEMDILKNYQAALHDYSRAIELNPNSAQAYYNRGLLRLRMNDPATACPDFKKVKELGYDRADELIDRFCR